METTKTILILNILLLTAVQSFADETLNRVQSLVKKINPQVIEWRRDFHQHPELSNRESRTGRVIAEHLRAIGVDSIQTKIAHNGVVALIKGDHDGPCVALRADIDALPIDEQTGLPYASQNPGVMHACGHDCHTAMLLGAAKVLTQLKDEIHGTVKLIFQPCEEGAPAGEEGGAELMVKEGVLDNPKVSAIFGQHVNPLLETGKLGYTPEGACAAVDQFKIVIQGKQTHAAYPWKGIDPVVTTAHIVTALQTIHSRVVDTRETAVISIGKINGGARWNIIPNQVTMEGTIRTHNSDVRRQIQKTFRRIVNQTAASHGAKAQIDLIDYGPVMWNDLPLTNQMLSTLQSTAGAENVIKKKPTMGGEDFAFYSQKIPGFYYNLGVRNEDIGAVNMLHTPNMIVDENAFPLGIQTMTMLAINYLKQ